MTRMITKVTSNHNQHVLTWEWRKFTRLPEIPTLKDVLEYEMDYATFMETTDNDKQINLINKWIDTYAVYEYDLEMRS